MKVLVCGGQNYRDEKTVFSELDARRNRITCLIEGGGSGVALFAKNWALKRKIPVEEYRPDIKLGTRTRITERNKKMIEARPDLVLAFTGGEDTDRLVSKARAAGIPVEVINEVADRDPICPSCGVRQELDPRAFKLISIGDVALLEHCTFCDTPLAMTFEDHKWKCEESTEDS